MKININIDPASTETEITINIAGMTDELDRVIAALRAVDSKITGTKHGETFILDAAKIMYADTVDKKTFLYTKEDVYETALRLYELEAVLPAKDFFRAGKSSIINFCKIKSLQSDIGGRIIVVLENNERLVVSKQYASNIKDRLGMK